MGLKSLIKTRVRSFLYHATYLIFKVTKILFQNLLKNSAKISQFRFNFCEILSFGRTKLSINKCSINPNKADIFRTCFTFCNLTTPVIKSHTTITPHVSLILKIFMKWLILCSIIWIFARQYQSHLLFI